MMQMYPDPDDLTRAQDSIDNRLHNYGKNLWVPTQEEYLAMKEKEAADAEALAKGDSIPDRTVVKASDDRKPSARKSTRKRSTRKPKTIKSKASNSNGPASNAERSVRRRRR